MAQKTTQRIKRADAKVAIRTLLIDKQLSDDQIARMLDIAVNNPMVCFSISENASTEDWMMAPVEQIVTIRRPDTDRQREEYLEERRSKGCGIW